MMKPAIVNQEPRTFSVLADKYGHPQRVRLPDNYRVGPDRVAAALRADKYGHVLQNISSKQLSDSTVSNAVRERPF